VVPTLVLDDGAVIGEVPAIMRYLDEAFPEKPLLRAMPEEGPDRDVGAARRVGRPLEPGVTRSEGSALFLRSLQDLRSL
jgi:glutathione S-transferase